VAIELKTLLLPDFNKIFSHLVEIMGVAKKSNCSILMYQNKTGWQD